MLNLNSYNQDLNRKISSNLINKNTKKNGLLNVMQPDMLK